MANKGPSKRKLQQALIWWTESHQKSNIPASKIPKKKQFPDALTAIYGGQTEKNAENYKQKSLH